MLKQRLASKCQTELAKTFPPTLISQQYSQVGTNRWVSTKTELLKDRATKTKLMLLLGKKNKQESKERKLFVKRKNKKLC